MKWGALKHNEAYSSLFISPDFDVVPVVPRPVEVLNLFFCFQTHKLIRRSRISDADQRKPKKKKHTFKERS
jgi:hypothetical protein